MYNLAMNKKILIALGGNAIITEKQTGTYSEQLESVSITAKLLSDLIAENYSIVIAHGNGPQVGNLLLQHAAAKDQVPELPMDICGAQSQGQIGYLIQQQIKNELLSRDIQKDVCTVVTQTAVSASDPAFENPTKPVGPFYSKEEIEKKDGFIFKEDAGRGYRRIVASPQPIEILEFNIIKKLYESGNIVISGGGGGVPVVKKENKYFGVEAVIDKDKSSALLARDLQVDMFVILTGVKQVSLNFNTPQQQDIAQMTVLQAQKYCEEGHFAPGSMLPKIEAAIWFAKETGKKTLITSPDSLQEALDGKTGTFVVD